MKVAVDARMLKMSGIGTYIQNLMKNDCYNIALGRKDEIQSVKEGVETIEFDTSIYGIKEQLKFPYKKLKKAKIDVLHVPHYNVPLFYRGKMVVTIHDLTHLIFPEFLPNKFAYFYAKFMIWFATKRADKIIVDSENTKNDILKMFKVKPDKIKVIYLAAGEEFIEKPKEEIKYLYDKFNIPQNKKLLMYVGNLKPHKNLERLLKAFSKLNNKEECILILVGKAFEKYNILEDKEMKLQIENNVIRTGIVSQQELIDLYNLVDLFVFPSLYEGFGIPVLEALNCGTKVVCSNTSSLPEVGGDVVDYFNPYDIDEIALKIQNNTSISNKKLNINSWISKFNWKKTAMEFKKIIKII